MWLHMNGETLTVLQASEEAIKLADVSRVKAGDAIFEISVDDDSRKQPIRVLAEGWNGNWVAIEDR